MAQTTNHMSSKSTLVAYNPAEAGWVAIAGMTFSVNVSGGARQSAGTQTFDGDTSLLTIGKREIYQVTVNGLYTEDATDFYDAAQAAYENNTKIGIRWIPNPGSLRYTTNNSDYSVVVEPPYPDVNAASADPVFVTLVVAADSVEEVTT